MSLDALKQQVLAANVELSKRGLTMATWGNVSGVDRDAGVLVIKPSGVDYSELREDSLAVVRLDDGRWVDGLAPSTDTPTHLELFRRFPSTGGVAHTHSTWATIWAQAQRPIPCFGTTHADHFRGDVPCTRMLTGAEINGDYERETGAVIAEAFAELDPAAIPAVLVASHGPFVWGPDPTTAVANAGVLEVVAMMAYHAQALSPDLARIDIRLLDRHFLRKHGATAYYGQRS